MEGRSWQRISPSDVADAAAGFMRGGLVKKIQVRAAQQTLPDRLWGFREDPEPPDRRPGGNRAQKPRTGECMDTSFPSKSLSIGTQIDNISAMDKVQYGICVCVR